MRRILTAVFCYLFFLANCWAASGSGNVSNVVQFGGAGITSSTAYGNPPQITVPLGSLSSLVTLFAGNGSTTANNYYYFYSASSPASGSQTIFSVPGGKTFFLLGAYIQTGTANEAIQFGYGTAIGGSSENSNTAPTNATYYSATSTTTTTPVVTSAVAPAYTYYPINFSFPAGALPFVRPGSASAMGVMLMGIVQ